MARFPRTPACRQGTRSCSIIAGNGFRTYRQRGDLPGASPTLASQEAAGAGLTTLVSAYTTAPNAALPEPPEYLACACKETEVMARSVKITRFIRMSS
jgi:hypothetical protein